MEQKYPIGCGDGSSQIYGASTVTLRAMNWQIPMADPLVSIGNNV